MLLTPQVQGDTSQLIPSDWSSDIGGYKLTRDVPFVAVNFLLQVSEAGYGCLRSIIDSL